MSQFTPEPTDSASIATIRTLAADVVGKANSGHPGKPLDRLLLHSDNDDDTI
jgi:transketolase